MTAGKRGWILLSVLVFYTLPATAAQVGVQYIRGETVYPTTALADFERFHEDRINTIMIALPWSHWEDQPGRINPTFISNMAPAMEYAAQHGMSVVIASHINVNNGVEGNWQIPTWIQNMDEYLAPSSYLTVPEVRTEHVNFINRMIDTTKDFEAVVGYVISKEAVSSSQWYVTSSEGRKIFDARWAGLIDNAERVRQYMDTNGVTQYLSVGANDLDENYSSYTWANNGTIDLTNFWTKTIDVIGNQGAPGLQRSDQWYPNATKIRTEGRIYGAGFYDYDQVYEYEGLQNAAVQNLDAFYPWEIGNFSNPWTKTLNILDDRNGGRNTQYYWALRDLASGVDSFETYLDADLPATDGTSQVEFDPATARAGISNRWTGTGEIVGQKDRLPGQAPSSTMAATVTLDPSEKIGRSVISEHWADSGVTIADAFKFLARTDEDCEIWMVVYSANAVGAATINLAGSDWDFYEVSFIALGLEYEDISQITDITFFNFSEETISFDIDEFLIRPAIHIPGDANGDGVVSAGDYASIQANFGNTGVAGIPGDANGDGVVSAGDYASVQANFGRTEGIPSANQIPEPTTLSLLTAGVITLLRKRKPVETGIKEM